MHTATSHSLIKYFPPVILLAALFVGAPQAMSATTGSGRIATESRNVSDFEAITISGSMKLEVRQTGKETLSLSGEDNLLPLIETVVEPGANGRILHIRFKRGESIRPQREIKVSVEVIKLGAVSTSGAGDIRIDGVKGAALKVVVSGAGDVSMRGVAVDGLDVRIAGSGDVRGQGTAKQLTLSIAGSGDAALADFVADAVKVSIAGSGDAQVHASKSLEVRIAGSGDVQYRGGATDVSKTVMGSGSVTPMR